MWRRRISLPCLTLLLLVALAPTVVAHGDGKSVSGVVQLAPGETLTTERELHYHRLVGSVEAPVGAVELTVTDPDGVTERLAGPGQDLRLNHLIACCKDQTWTSHLIIVRNVGETPIDVRVQLALLHDDFAVVAEDAEQGAWWQTLLFVMLIALVPVIVARRTAIEDPQRARRWLHIGSGALAAAWGLAAFVSLAGMLRYGGGPLVGLRAGLSPFPVTHAFVGSLLLLALPLITLWTIALVGAAIAIRGGHPGGRLLGRLAAAGPLVFGVLFAIEYGNIPLAVLLGSLPAAMLVLAFEWPRRALASDPPGHLKKSA